MSITHDGHLHRPRPFLPNHVNFLHSLPLLTASPGRPIPPSSTNPVYSASLESSTLKAAKANNTLGSPIHLPSKPLALIPDPTPYSGAVYVAESAGTVRRVVLDVGASPHPYILWARSGSEIILGKRSRTEFWLTTRGSPLFTDMQQKPSLPLINIDCPANLPRALTRSSEYSSTHHLRRVLG